MKECYLGPSTLKMYFKVDKLFKSYIVDPYPSMWAGSDDKAHVSYIFSFLPLFISPRTFLVVLLSPRSLNSQSAFQISKLVMGCHLGPQLSKPIFRFSNLSASVVRVHKLPKYIIKSQHLSHAANFDASPCSWPL